MAPKIHIQRYSGAALIPFIPDLARLRIEVFRDFPYLYDGTLDYEQKYLQTYINNPSSVIVLALNGEKVVGASTALPMRDETPELQRPFLDNGYDLTEVFYCSESVLDKNYRGLGIGVRFFEEREAHADYLGGFKHITFCCVERPADHPRRTANYVPLDNFWNKRGYVKHPELHTSYLWKDLDDAEETAKPMTFWLKHER
ncbi:GNAT family N-acetyltransferase [Methylovulum psychrotolerans]|uniref:GNAT family N-acetyltransferase n=1 Tax=Methylovulum psychrotolerans TaxID=1704499 RepID=A0A2S5CMV0_9GAMM|nr:GNAT family N-acetyltransferase [Methylovulum psychrotolerans]POZ52153.1 GNAT family N-acetyltransferase [Methylovulum psychrotolerans]